MSFECISTEDAKALIDSSEVTLADVRDARSYSRANIPDSVHVTRQTLDDFIAKASKEQPLIVYCYHGNMSKDAANLFIRHGFKRVYSMDGGFDEWQAKYL